MKNQNAKAATGDDRSSFLNTLNQLDGDQMVSAFNNARKPQKNQRICVCGAPISRDEVILNKAKLCSACRQNVKDIKEIVSSVLTTPRRVLKCIPCRSCRKPFLPQKLVTDLMICRDCLKTAQTETPAKRSRIIAEVVKNYTMALQRQVFAGGRA